MGITFNPFTGSLDYSWNSDLGAIGVIGPSGGSVKAICSTCKRAGIKK